MIYSEYIRGHAPSTCTRAFINFSKHTEKRADWGFGSYRCLAVELIYSPPSSSLDEFSHESLHLQW